MLKFVLALALLSCAVAIPGGWYDVKVDDEAVVTAAKEATKSVGVTFSLAYHTKLVRIVEAKSQIVAGRNFKLTVVLGLTNCKRNEVDFDDVDSCEFQEGERTYHRCEVVVYRDLQSHHRVIRSVCKSASEDDL